MRPLALLVAAALAAAARPAGATDLVLRLDLGYDRLDQLGADADHGQRLDFDTAFLGAGSIVAPGAIDWSLGAAWHGLRSTAIGGRSLDSDRLSFGARLGLLQRPSSPFTLVLHADRAQTDFTTETGQARATGTITTTTFGGDAYYRSADRPSLRLGATRIASEDSGLGRGASERNALRLRGGLVQGTAGYSISADYDGELADGTFDSDNFHAHTLTVNASANLAPTVDARLTERYYLRTPTRVSSSNPRYEDNQLFASAFWTGTLALSRTAYRFSHTLISAPATAERERLVNAASEQYEHQLAPEFRLIGLAALSTAEDRLAGVSSRSTGADGTLLGRWLHHEGALDLTVQAGGSGGVQQPEGGGSRSAWGAQLEGGVSGPLLGARAGARYAFNFQDNLGAVGGWALRQSLSGDLEARPAADLTMRLSLQATADRLQSDTFGGGANRLVQLIGSARWLRWHGDLVAGVSSGILGAPSGGVHGDGLFVPAPFNTHSTFASLAVVTDLAQGLQARLQGRFLDLRQPDRERQYELGVLGGLSYVAGALLLSVEDEYVTGGGGRSASQNRILVRATRSFGGRF